MTTAPSNAPNANTISETRQSSADVSVSFPTTVGQSPHVTAAMIRSAIPLE